GAVWRKVWRPRARDQDWRLLDRAMRRHAHGRDGRDWADQDFKRRQRVVGSAAGGGRDGRGLAGAFQKRSRVGRGGVQVRLPHPSAKNAEGWGTLVRGGDYFSCRSAEG